MVSGLLPSRCLTETSTGRIPRTCYTKPVEGEVRGCLTSTLLLCSPSIRAILSISIHIYTHWLQLQLCHQRLFRHALASDTASTALFLHLFSFSPFNKVTHLLTLTLSVVPYVCGSRLWCCTRGLRFSRPPSFPRYPTFTKSGESKKFELLMH